MTPSGWECERVCASVPSVCMDIGLLHPVGHSVTSRAGHVMSIVVLQGPLAGLTLSSPVGSDVPLLPGGPEPATLSRPPLLQAPQPGRTSPDAVGPSLSSGSSDSPLRGQDSPQVPGRGAVPGQPSAVAHDTQPSAPPLRGRFSGLSAPPPPPTGADGTRRSVRRPSTCWTSSGTRPGT